MCPVFLKKKIDDSPIRLYVALFPSPQADVRPDEEDPGRERDGLQGRT